MFLFDKIEEDIKKHKMAGLTDEEIDELPPLKIIISDHDFIDMITGWNPVAYKKQELVKQALELGLLGKAAESYIKVQLSIWEKEQRRKAEEEAKLLGTAMQQLLPEIFEDKRAIPNCFLRGALFGMVRKGRRALVENQPIFTMSQYEVSFSGSEMDQNDLEVWDTLMYLAKERNVDNELRITLYDLCQQMRIANSGANRDALVSRIKRLNLMNYKEGLYKKTSGLSIKILTKIGKYSYETYLTHMIVLMVAINILTEYTIQLNIIILYALLIFIMVITAWVFSLVSSQMVLAVKWIQKVLRHINAADKE